MNRSLVLAVALVPAAPAAAQCLDWAPGFALPGADQTVVSTLSVMESGQPVLYVGGRFDTVGDAPAPLVARWDGSHWSGLGDGPGGVPGDEVGALAVHDDGSGPALFVALNGLPLFGETTARVMRWDGATWIAAGSGFTLPSGVARVAALQIFDDGSGPVLYAGGSFTVADGQEAIGFAAWNGSSWSPSTPAYGIADLLVFDDGAGPALYAAGVTTPGGPNPEDIARWTGSTWVPLVGGETFEEAKVLAVHDDGTGPKLVASVRQGSFDIVVQWDGASWSKLGQAVQNQAVASFDDGTGARLYAADFDVQVLEAGLWTPMASLENLTPTPTFLGRALVLDVHDDGSGPRLLVGGIFNLVDDEGLHNLAAFDGSDWSTVEPPEQGLDFSVNALHEADLGAGPRLYAAGDFVTAGTSKANRFAEWTGSGWNTFANGLVNGPAHALAAYDDGSGPALYVGGGFDTAGGMGALNIARLRNGTWESIGGANRVVDTLAVIDDGSGPVLYAGGYFNRINGVLVHKLGRYDGSAWTSLAGGFDTNFGPSVRTIAGFDSGSGIQVHAGGDFTVAGSVAASNVARWNGTDWEDLAGGTDDVVHVLLGFDDGGGARLWVGGDFSTAGGLASPHLATWDGGAWAAVPGGAPDGPVTVLQVFDEGAGAVLYVGGEFTTIGGVAAAGAARWDGSEWRPLGAGVVGTPVAMAVHDDGTAAGARLFVGGDLTVAGSRAVGSLAVWEQGCACPPASYCTAGTTTSGCAALLSATGVASLSSATGFDVSVDGVEGAKQGLIYFGTTGAKATPWGAGTSYACVQGPHQRTSAQFSNGNAGSCDGSFALDFNAWMASEPAKAPAPGATVWMQAWFRDPPAPKTTALSDGLRFHVCP